MSQEMGRRAMMGAAGAAVMAGALGGRAQGMEIAAKRKIVAVSCSSRKGKTTAEALGLCLAAAREKYPEIETELIELADLSIPAQVAAGEPLRDGETDDFPKLIELLGDPAVAGIIVGSPVYFNNMSALCKAFLDRCIVFRKDSFRLKDKVAGALAVGSTRNGGQEMTVASILASLASQDMAITGTGQPTARVGATLWNQNETVAGDEFGASTAQDLGRRVAELSVALK
jgi:multimeric flavodoxin WrbA